MTSGRQTTASVRLWLERLWHQGGSRKAFWDAILLASKPTSSGHARATFSQAVIDLVEAEGDLLPLAERVLAEGHGVGPAHHALGFVCNQVAAEPTCIIAAPWLGLCELVATTSVPAALTHCSLFLAALTEKGNLDEDARLRAAEIARSLLASAWLSCDATASQTALGCALSAFDAAPKKAALQLMRVLQERELPDREHAISVLTLHARNLLKVNEPNVHLLVASLYELVGSDVGAADRRSYEQDAAWLARAYEDPSAGGERRPPHEVSKWAAVVDDLDDPRVLVTFLRVAPTLAARTLVRVLRAFEPTVSKDSMLRVRGRDVPVLGRANWPVLSSGFDAAVRDRLCEAVSERAETEPDVAASMIDAMADEHAPIDTWQALVMASRFCLPLVGLLSDLYASDDAVRLLSAAIAASVRKHGALFPSEVRRSLEQTLARLDRDGLAAFARRFIEPALRGEGDEAEAVDDDERDDSGTDGGASSIALAGNGGRPRGVDREMLRFRGMLDAEIDHAPNVAVQTCEALAEESASEIGPDLAGKVPAANSQAIERAKVRLRDLQAALDVESVHAGQLSSGWGMAARLASALARQGDDDVLGVLLDASQRPAVESRVTDLHNRLREEAFVACLDGLVTLAGRGIPRALEAVMQAASDDEPAVRFHVAERVHVLVDVADDYGWRIVESLVRDRHPMVVSAATKNFGPFYERDGVRGIALDWAVLETTRGQNAYLGQANALARLAWNHLRMDNPTAGSYLARGIEMVSELADPIGQLVHRYRPWLVLGGERTEGPNDAEVAAMGRTWRMFTSISDAALQALASDGNVASEINAQLHNERPGAARVIDDVAHQLYFASGAFQNKPKLTSQARKRYWRDASSLLMKLGECGIVAAAHPVLETLEHLLEFSTDVPWDGAFSMFLRVAQSAVGHGYTRGWSGIDLIDRVLRRGAADHPMSFKLPEARAKMSAILDAFLEAGWPKAYLLARDLDLSDSRRSLIR